MLFPASMVPFMVQYLVVCGAHQWCSGAAVQWCCGAVVQDLQVVDAGQNPNPDSQSPVCWSAIEQGPWTRRDAARDMPMYHACVQRRLQGPAHWSLLEGSDLSRDPGRDSGTMCDHARFPFPQAQHAGQGRAGQGRFELRLTLTSAAAHHPSTCVPSLSPSSVTDLSSAI